MDKVKLHQCFFSRNPCRQPRPLTGLSCRVNESRRIPAFNCFRVEQQQTSDTSDTSDVFSNGAFKRIMSQGASHTVQQGFTSQTLRSPASDFARVGPQKQRFATLRRDCFLLRR